VYPDQNRPAFISRLHSLMSISCANKARFTKKLKEINQDIKDMQKYDVRVWIGFVWLRAGTSKEQL
jgi:hypothetical protein